jgi:hypothetical protein
MSNSELEQKIMKEDIEKAKELGITIGKVIGKSVVYPIGTTFAFPTIFHKAVDYDDSPRALGDGDLAKGWTIAGEY